MSRPRKVSLEKNFKFGKERITKSILCSSCKEREIQVDGEITSVICWKCCSHMGPEMVVVQQKEKSGFPRGWAFFKEFVDVEGNVYHKGEIQPKLKGTLPQTILKETPKLSKSERRRLKEEKLIKKEEKLAKQYKKKMKIKKQKEKENDEQFFEYDRTEHKK